MSTTELEYLTTELRLRTARVQEQFTQEPDMHIVFDPENGMVVESPDGRPYARDGTDVDVIESDFVDYDSIAKDRTNPARSFSSIDPSRWASGKVAARVMGVSFKVVYETIENYEPGQEIGVILRADEQSQLDDFDFVASTADRAYKYHLNMGKPSEEAAELAQEDAVAFYKNLRNNKAFRLYGSIMADFIADKPNQLEPTTDEAMATAALSDPEQAKARGDKRPVSTKFLAARAAGNISGRTGSDWIRPFVDVAMPGDTKQGYGTDDGGLFRWAVRSAHDAVRDGYSFDVDGLRVGSDPHSAARVVARALREQNNRERFDVTRGDTRMERGRSEDAARVVEGFTAAAQSQLEPGTTPVSAIGQGANYELPPPGPTADTLPDLEQANTRRSESSLARLGRAVVSRLGGRKIVRPAPDEVN